MAKNKAKIVSKKHLARLERERRQARLIRNISIGIAVVVILLLGYGYLDQTVLQLRKPVVEVGNQKATVAQFQARVRMERQRLINNYIQFYQLSQMGLDVTSQLQTIEERLNKPEGIGQDVIDGLVNEMIYREEAPKMGITVSEEEVEEKIRAYHGYFPDGTPTPTLTPTSIPPKPTLSPEQLSLVTLTPTFTPLPTATPDTVSTPTPVPSPTPTDLPTPIPTPYTLEAYQQAYQETIETYKEYGLTEQDIRDLFAAGIYYEKIYAAVTADVPHEQEEVWARHILVKDEATAKEIRQRLLDGEDFAALAAEYSIDPGSAKNGGDLGWFPRGRMVPQFEEAAFNLPIGEISQPIQTQYGYHIIQVLGHDMLPMTSSEYKQACDNRFQEWLDNARASLDIKINEELWKQVLPDKPDLMEALNQMMGQQPQP